MLLSHRYKTVLKEQQDCSAITDIEYDSAKEQELLKQFEQLVMDYKRQKLAGKGLHLLPEPDVPNVGGLDLLEKDWEKIKALFSREAQQEGLHPPKGALLWGLPGTGKSLVAKMAAKKLGAILVSGDWNQLLESTIAESLDNLQYLLDLVDNSGPCILFFDEFEKAFSGWNSETGGGVLTKMAGKLLSWMQDHTSPVIMLATINHLDMLPPELVRRFEYVWFFDSHLHNGAMWEVFKLHLEKHYPGCCEKFDDKQWRKLFIDYGGCSPDEIGKAVKRVHDTLFFGGYFQKKVHPKTVYEALIEERNNFRPAIASQSISDKMAKILQEADFARPVRGSDRSRFATSNIKLYESCKDIPEKDFIPQTLNL